MRTLIISALAATLCAAPAMAQPADTPARMAARPTEVNLQIEQDLGELINALNQSNANFTALPYIYGARIGYFGSNAWVLRFNYYTGDIRIKDVKVLERKGDEVKATISYAFITRSNDETSKAQMENQQETLDFKLVQLPLKAKTQVWQIVPPADKPPVIGAKNNDVLWANIAYHIAQKETYKPDGTPVERSINNLKWLGLGVAQFIQDYDEVYAFEPRYLSEALLPYVSSDTSFQVPDTNEMYTFNGNLSGLNLAKVNEVYRTVLFYEGQNQTPIFRYDGKAAICFADGHVALVTPDEAQKLIWKP